MESIEDRTDSQRGYLSLKQISKSFEDFPAVDAVDLDIEPGEFLTLLGPSGCGKTTLLRMIAGFERPSFGELLLDGKDMVRLPPERRPLNMVFQRYALFPHLNVFQNVAYGLQTKGMSGPETTDRVRSALEMVDMGPSAHRSVKQLSGGQAQRIALARALVNEPRVLLLDEPLGALDLQLRKRMQLELRAIQHRLKTTFVYVTHDQEEALAMSHRIVVMNRGRVVQVGPPAEVYHRPATGFVAAFVGESTALPCAVSSTGESVADVVLDVNGTILESVPVPEQIECDPGERAFVVLRPEDVGVTPAGEGRIDGRLEDVIFVGSTHRCFVRLADQTTVKADTTMSGLLRPGDQVGITWSDGGGVVVKDQT